MNSAEIMEHQQSETKEIRVEVSLKNNRIYQLRKKLGLFQKEIGLIIGVSQGHYGMIENFKESPICTNPKHREYGSMKPWVAELCSLFNVTPEYLWPDDLKNAIAKNYNYELSMNEAKQLSVGNPERRLLDKECSLVINDVLQTLTERERKVIEARFGLNGKEEKAYEEIGEDWDVTRERIRQIEAKALRKLRHPDRSGQLVPYMPSKD